MITIRMTTQTMMKVPLLPILVPVLAVNVVVIQALTCITLSTTGAKIALKTLGTVTTRKILL